MLKTRNVRQPRRHRVFHWCCICGRNLQLYSNKCYFRRHNTEKERCCCAAPLTLCFINVMHPSGTGERINVPMLPITIVNRLAQKCTFGSVYAYNTSVLWSQHRVAAHSHHARRAVTRVTSSNTLFHTTRFHALEIENGVRIFF